MSDNTPKKDEAPKMIRWETKGGAVVETNANPDNIAAAKKAGWKTSDKSVSSKPDKG